MRYRLGVLLVVLSLCACKPRADSALKEGLWKRAAAEEQRATLCINEFKPLVKIKLEAFAKEAGVAFDFDKPFEIGDRPAPGTPEAAAREKLPRKNITFTGSEAFFHLAKYSYLLAPNYENVCRDAAKFTVDRNIEDHWSSKLVADKIANAKAALDIGSWFCPLVGVPGSDCRKYFDDIFRILSPQPMEGYDFAGYVVFDGYLADLVARNPSFDASFSKMLQSVKAETKITMTEPKTNLVSLEYDNSRDLWKELLDVTNQNPEISITMLGMLAHDIIPSFYNYTILRLVADGQYSRALDYMLFMEYLSPQIMTSRAIGSSIIPELKKSAQEIRHGIAGALLACSLRKLQYSPAPASFAALFTGAGYETLDFWEDHMTNWIYHISDQAREETSGESSADRDANPSLLALNLDKLRELKARLNVAWKERDQLRTFILSGYQDTRSHYLGGVWGSQQCGRQP